MKVKSKQHSKCEQLLASHKAIHSCENILILMSHNHYNTCTYVLKLSVIWPRKLHYMLFAQRFRVKYIIQQILISH